MISIEKSNSKQKNDLKSKKKKPIVTELFLIYLMSYIFSISFVLSFNYTKKNL